MEHELTLRVTATFVIQLIFFHSNLPINLVLLKICANRCLPLVVLIILHYDVLIRALQPLSIACHLLGRDLSSLSGVLARLTVTSLLFNHSQISFRILLNILILQSFLVGHAGPLILILALLSSTKLQLRIHLPIRYNLTHHLLTHLKIPVHAHGTLRYSIIRHLSIDTNLALLIILLA